MANYENIKPYAEFAHVAAQHGGIEKYLSMIAEANRRLGILEERSTEGRKAALVVGAAILIWEGGKAGIRFIKNQIEERKSEEEALLMQSNNAKAAIIRKYANAEAEESENTSSTF